MRRISSRATFSYKWLFPATWFGFVIIFAGAPIVLSLLAHQSPSASFIIPPVIMLVIGYFFMRKFLFDLVDEVWDDGNELVVRNGRREDRIRLSDIKNVGYSPMMSPPRVTLSLRKVSIFGDSVSFCAPFRFLPFSPSPVINELIDRVDAQRRKA
jgi:hypothetical protein